MDVVIRYASQVQREMEEKKYFGVEQISALSFRVPFWSKVKLCSFVCVFAV